ncbi:MAG: DinB family protein [Cytophagaceae bacterium]|nr:DinB family protein [Cytophagaceae bacterium]MBL0303049.1 DinB family protein [Cytophagaceae bacterium]
MFKVAKRNEIGELPKFFDRYIVLSDENAELLDSLEQYSPENIFSDLKTLEAIGGKVYAAGKWSVKDILQHCIDTERIMAFRALAFSRADENELPGFDEETYAQHTVAINRSIEDLIQEFSTVRKSTISLFKNMDKMMVLRKGTANHTHISPLALGFVIVGHPRHHFNVIKERYFDLAK